jgi:membrane protease YdiL (CAAX protease family)
VNILLILLGIAAAPFFAAVVWFVLLPQWKHIDAEWLGTAAPKGADSAAQAADPTPGAGKPPRRRQRGKREPRQARSAADAPASRAAGYDFRPLMVLVTVAVSLTLQEYIGERTMFGEWFPELITGKYGLLRSFAWWTSWRFIGYVVLPLIVIAWLPGERARDYFVSPKNFFRHLPIYLGLFVLVSPAVLIAAQNQSFYLTYPFYKWANRSALDLWMWEAMYAIQFLSLEFFFRGFILKGLAPKFGSAAIFVMVVPYCMIHYGKPLPETFGAIIAGTILGTLALRTRSIWGGVVIHVGVAITMDMLAVGHCPLAATGFMCPTH